MISPFSEGAASTKRFLNFSKRLSKNNKVTIIMPNYDVHSNYKKITSEKKDNINIIYPRYPKIKFLNLYAYLYMLSSCFSVLKGRFDIIYALKASPLSISGIVAKKYHKKILVLDVDDLESEVIKEQKGKGVIYLLSKYFEKMMPRNSEEIIVVSSYLKREAEKDNELKSKKIKRGI